MQTINSSDGKNGFQREKSAIHTQKKRLYPKTCNTYSAVYFELFVTQEQKLTIFCLAVSSGRGTLFGGE